MGVGQLWHETSKIGELDMTYPNYGIIRMRPRSQGLRSPKLVPVLQPATPTLSPFRCDWTSPLSSPLLVESAGPSGRMASKLTSSQDYYFVYVLNTWGTMYITVALYLSSGYSRSTSYSVHKTQKLYT